MGSGSPGPITRHFGSSPKNLSRGDAALAETNNEFMTGPHPKTGGPLSGSIWDLPCYAGSANNREKILRFTNQITLSIAGLYYHCGRKFTRTRRISHCEPASRYAKTGPVQATSPQSES